MKFCDCKITEETCLHLVDDVLLCQKCYETKNDPWNRCIRHAKSISHYELVKLYDLHTIKECEWNHLHAAWFWMDFCTPLYDCKLLKIIETYDLSTIKTVDLSGWKEDNFGCGYEFSDWKTAMSDFIRTLCYNATLTSLVGVNLVGSAFEDDDLIYFKRTPCSLIVVDRNINDEMKALLKPIHIVKN
jgi:hypothetical protein